MGYKDHMYALSSKSGSEPFRFALFLGDLRWNDPLAKYAIFVHLYVVFMIFFFIHQKKTYLTLVLREIKKIKNFIFSRDSLAPVTLNGAIWCVLEHNFILYLLKKIHFLCKTNYKL